MKRVEAVIRPHKLGDVKDALHDVGVLLYRLALLPPGRLARCHERNSADKKYHRYSIR